MLVKSKYNLIQFNIRYGEIYFVSYENENTYTIVNDKKNLIIAKKENFEIVDSGELLDTFDKSMLKTGMVVETKNGTRWLVVNDTMINEDGFMRLKDYNDDLTFHQSYDYGIVKVFDVQQGHLLLIYKLKEALNLIWVRKEVKEMTIGEIEEKLGCKIKIVK